MSSLSLQENVTFTFAELSHTTEWRHAHGMRCLGIPNTAHFANVTNIEDAMALWEKIKVQKFEDAWKPDHEEEYEDSKGNVVNKKVISFLQKKIP